MKPTTEAEKREESNDASVFSNFLRVQVKSNRQLIIIVLFFCKRLSDNNGLMC